MTKLLVSVRSAEEAQGAIAGGADLIDIKEPRKGSLGRAEPQSWQAIAEVVPDGVLLSVACGELSELQGTIPPTAWKGISLAKIGPAGTGEDWQARWDHWRKTLPAAVKPVAVAYADWSAAKAPRPELILRHGAAAGCRWALLDTFQKDGRSLLDFVSLAEVAAWRTLAEELHLSFVLAGSLRKDQLELLLPLAPAAIAVRGAVCRGGRSSAIAKELVREWAELFT